MQRFSLHANFARVCANGDQFQLRIVGERRWARRETSVTDLQDDEIQSLFLTDADALTLFRPNNSFCRRRRASFSSGCLRPSLNLNILLLDRFYWDRTRDWRVIWKEETPLVEQWTMIVVMMMKTIVHDCFLSNVNDKTNNDEDQPRTKRTGHAHHHFCPARGCLLLVMMWEE